MTDRPPDDANFEPSVEPTVPVEFFLRTGVTLGPYVLREKIGEGGMGEVWRAEQTSPIRRTVALKLIKPGMDSREVATRFEAERQALALMNHPSIASVFDAATTPAGRPYFAMEYVRGIRITEYCDQRRLSVEDRLRLFQRVCEAVHHAHQKAILHRDLKPSNILVGDVDSKPLPKIIDFGVAKATAFKLTEHTMYTARGQLIGTPEFMSPEQADLSGEDVDIRTDIYSLGAILYVLLAGTLPFESGQFRKQGMAAIVRLLREQEPQRPSARFSTLGDETTELAHCRRTGPRRLIGQLEGDLDWIVMRCLEKDRNRRYGSALDLSRDIQRHLDHVPVEACPPSFSYRARKFVRRHQLAVGISVAAAAVLVGFSVTTAVQSARVASERDRASHEAAVSAEVSEFLVQLFELSDPRKSQGNTITAREILDDGAARMRQKEWQDPGVQSRLVSIMATVYSGLGISDDAHELYLQALALNESNFGPQHRRTLTSRYQLGISHFVRGEYEEAEDILREVLEDQKRTLDADQPDAAATAQGLARLLRNTGRLDAAEVLYLEALISQEALLGKDDITTADTMNQLGILYWSRGQYDDAEPLLIESLIIADQVLGPDDPTTLTYRNNMAAFEQTATHWEDLAPHRARAEELYLQCIEAQRRILGPDHPETLRTIFNLGSLLVAQDRLDEAQPLIEEAALGRSRTLGDTHRTTLLAQISMANIWRRQGRTREAEELLLEILKKQREILEPHHREIRFTLSELYEIRAEEGRLEEARPILRDLLAVHRNDADRENASAEEHDRYAWTLATCEIEEFQDAELALTHATAAVEMSERRNPRYLRTLARTQSISGDPTSANATLREALELMGPDDPERIEYEEDLATLREAGLPGSD